jgi:hypothetical protein
MYRVIFTLISIKVMVSVKRVMVRATFKMANKQHLWGFSCHGGYAYGTVGAATAY